MTKLFPHPPIFCHHHHHPLHPPPPENKGNKIPFYPRKLHRRENAFGMIFLRWTLESFCPRSTREKLLKIGFQSPPRILARVMNPPSWSNYWRGMDWKICQFWTQQWQQGISLIIHIFGLSSEERHNEISARLEFDKFGLDFYCRIYGPSLQVELKKKSEIWNWKDCRAEAGGRGVEHQARYQGGTRGRPKETASCDRTHHATSSLTILVQPTKKHSLGQKRKWCPKYQRRENEYSAFR